MSRYAQLVANSAAVLLFACEIPADDPGDATRDAGSSEPDHGGSGGRSGAASNGAASGGANDRAGAAHDDDPLVAIADALCARWYVCANELDIAVEYADPEQCRWSTLRGDLDMFPNATQPDAQATCDSFPPASTDDEEAVMTCIEAIEAAPCGATAVGENAMKQLRGPCRLAYDSMKTFFPAAKDDGEPCQEEEFCGFDAYCRVTDFDAYTGLCSPLTQEPGEPCDGDRRCKHGFQCVHEGDDTRCVDEPFDETCICKALRELPIFRPLGTGEEGESCEDSGQCKPGLSCDVAAPARVCVSSALGCNRSALGISVRETDGQGDPIVI